MALTGRGLAWTILSVVVFAEYAFAVKNFTYSFPEESTPEMVVGRVGYNIETSTMTFDEPITYRAADGGDTSYETVFTLHENGSILTKGRLGLSRRTFHDCTSRNN